MFLHSLKRAYPPTPQYVSIISLPFLCLNNENAKLAKSVVDATMLRYVCAMAKVSDTKSLRIIVDRFEDTDEALTVVALIEEFKGAMNRSTVYRILARLEEKGVLTSFTGKGGLKWYAKSQKILGQTIHSIKPHFQCEDCGKTERLPIKVSVPNLEKYQVNTASYLIMGSCGNCDEKR